MGEKLLVNPVASTYGTIVNFITYGAPDFLWFFTAYILNLSFLFMLSIIILIGIQIAERNYVGSIMGIITTILNIIYTKIKDYIKKLLNIIWQLIF